LKSPLIINSTKRLFFDPQLFPFSLIMLFKAVAALAAFTSVVVVHAVSLRWFLTFCFVANTALLDLHQYYSWSGWTEIPTFQYYRCRW
jgi:hypothetical protein